MNSNKSSLRLLAVAVAFVLSVVRLDAADPVKVDVSQNWQGSLPIENLGLLAKDHADSRVAFIGDAKQWAKVWQAVNADAEQPKVDFEKNIVVMLKNVQFVNQISVRGATLEDGTLKVMAVETRSARPVIDKVFCAMFVAPRAGINKISDGGPVTISLKPAGALSGKVAIKESEASFENAGVWIRLWEYDPRLADASAELFDSVKIEKVAHETGRASSIEFQLGDKSKLNKMREYYVTVFVYRDAKFGDNKSEIFFLDGFNKVKLPGEITGTLKKLNR